MKPISAKLEKIGENYYLKVPNTIVELMDWSVEEELLVPFHNIVQKDSSSWRKEINRKS